MRGLQTLWYIRTNIATLGALLMVLSILLLLAILAYDLFFKE